MRTRLVAAMTAAVLAVPFLPAAADASPSDHKCDTSVSTDEKCEETRG